MSKKRPKLDHQRTTANINNREETSSIIEYEYTGTGDRVPNYVQHVRIHSSVTKINNNSFYNCESLREVVLNDGLREIGESAFQECTALESIKQFHPLSLILVVIHFMVVAV